MVLTDGKTMFIISSAGYVFSFVVVEFLFGDFLSVGVSYGKEMSFSDLE